MKDKEQIKFRLCTNCGDLVDNPKGAILNNLTGALLPEHGKQIYFRVLEGKIRSIDLCNYCYTIKQYYRNTLTKEELKHYESEEFFEYIKHSNEEYLKEFVEYLKEENFSKWHTLQGHINSITNRGRLNSLLDQFNSLQRETNLKKGGEDETI